MESKEKTAIKHYNIAVFNLLQICVTWLLKKFYETQRSSTKAFTEDQWPLSLKEHVYAVFWELMIRVSFPDRSPNLDSRSEFE